MPDTPATTLTAMTAFRRIAFQAQGATSLGVLCSALSLIAPATQAAKPAPAPAPIEAPASAASAVQNSAMDAALFYQLLIAEIQSNAGDAGSAYQVYLEAAKRNQNNQLYKRAVEIALKAQAGEQALTAAKAWRQAQPQSREAAEYTAQILIALGRTADLASPLRTLIQLTPTPQQPQVIAGLPRTLTRLTDRQAVAQVIDDATQPWRQPPLEIAEAWAASGEGWLQAKNADKALTSTRKALQLKPDMPQAGLLAVDLIGMEAEAEPLVLKQLALAKPPTLIQLAYARKLAGLGRFEESATQLEAIVAAQPDQPGTWLTLAAVRLQLNQPDKAEQALQRPLQLSEHPEQASKPGDVTRVRTEDADSDLQQAWLLMAQVSEQKKQLPAALKWLDRADPKHTRASIQTQRARLLLRMDRLAEARAAIHGLPETEPRDAIIKIQTEAQLLKDARQLPEAYKLLQDGSKRFPDDSDLLYDQAMLADRLKHYDDMERLLRKVIEISPDNANAYNALGYGMVERGVRLSEAKKLIEKALEIRPGDPFITDSLGWLHFRAGQGSEAARVLKQAYANRADPEIGAHLGEVLWSLGQQDEARRILRESFQRDPENDTLRDTLQRLKITL
jgi:tetratricopeptide (TPR) repeat protein